MKIVTGDLGQIRDFDLACSANVVSILPGEP